MKAFETNVSEKSKCDKNNNNKCNIINKASFEKVCLFDCKNTVFDLLFFEFNF